MRSADRRWVDSMPAAYERGLVAAVFRPFAEDLAARAAALAPQRVLEIAAGTGVLTSAMVDAMPAAVVVATDLNQAMVDLGAQRCPAASWRTADAMDLPFGDAAFDLVACQFGAMFFPDPIGAFAEVRRTLEPGGAFLLNAWGAIGAHDFQAAVIAACDRLFPNDPPQFMRTVPHRYADAGGLADHLAAAGFTPAVETVVLETTTGSAADVAAGYVFGTPLRSEIEDRGADASVIVSEIGAELSRRLGPDPVTARMEAHVALATR